MSMAGLMFEGLVVLVLFLAAVLAWRIDRKLTALRAGTDGMAAAVTQLAEASARAQASIAALRAASDEAGADLEARVRRAAMLADELERMVEPGARPPRAAQPANASARANSDPAHAAATPRARELLQAVRTNR